MTIYTRTFTRRLELTGEVELDMDCRNGNLNLSAHDLAGVHIDVQASIQADSAEEADQEIQAIENGIELRGNQVRIKVPEGRQQFSFFGRGTTVNFEIRAPHSTTARIEARNGRVEVRGIAGPLAIDNRNGSVKLHEIDKDILVESRNGRIEASRCGGAIQVIGRNGAIELQEVTGTTTAETRNGAIVARDVGGALKLRSDNGLLRYSGAVLNDVDMEVSMGSIRLLVPSDSRFELDAESRVGTVRSDLPVREQPFSDAPRPKVRLRSNAGSIRIEPA